MSLAISQKMKIREGSTIRVLNPPPDYEPTLAPLPAGVTITSTGKSFQQLHWFARDRAAMDRDLEAVMNLLQDDVTCWIFFPKGTSKIQTDLNRDKGWEALERQDVQFITLISFNDTWSAFAIRRKNEADKKKESKPKERPVFQYVDPVKKTVKLPDELAAAMKKNKKEAAFFNTLSFSNKKEYIEWVVSAKQEATRKQRVAGTIERLSKGWKNPANR
ncbi:MAG TPA: YdeI/OmpD-associated family protein [Flavisolibacter sp.]